VMAILIGVLLKEGGAAYLDHRNSNGSTALCWSSFYGHTDVTRLLLMAGTSPPSLPPSLPPILPDVSKYPRITYAHPPSLPPSPPPSLPPSLQAPTPSFPTMTAAAP